MPEGLRLVGHKGADRIVPGNTPESFAAATRPGRHDRDRRPLDPRRPSQGRRRSDAAPDRPDWHDAERRRPLTLAEGLDAFLEPPLDRVEIDLDIKLPGREEEIVDAVRARPPRPGDDLDDGALDPGPGPRLEPRLRRGWTYPKVTRDWASKRWARLPMLAALVSMRRRFPAIAARELPEMGVSARLGLSPDRHPAAGRGRALRRRRADRLDRRRPRPDAEAGGGGGRRFVLERPPPVRLDQLIVRAPTLRRLGRPPSNRRVSKATSLPPPL